MSNQSLKGLSTKEANEKLNTYGLNQVIIKKKPFILKLLSYFWGPIAWMIELALVLSAINSKWTDFYVILFLLLLNITVSVFQERKANNIIEKLKNKLKLRARVLRDGSWEEIDASQIVPGDIVRLRQGDVVPADGKIISKDIALFDESSLTGESLPVEKKNNDVVYSSSLVKRGEVNIIITSTGMNTKFGKVAILSTKKQVKSTFQKNINKIIKYIIIISMILSIIIFIFALIYHQDIINTLQFILILVVASIPAALPAILSITLAIGAVDIAKRSAVVRNMIAIEDLASMDMLCLDKTGTLTLNNISVATINSFEKNKDSDVLLYSSLCSSKEDIDPIDSAIFTKLSEDKDLLSEFNNYKQKSFTAYNPVSKYSLADVIYKGQTITVAKGAPQAILKLTKSKASSKVNKIVEDLAKEGERALGVAIKEKGSWKYVGVLGLYDPPRKDSIETLKIAKKMGVIIKIITGDHEAITKHIARELNIGDYIVDANTFESSKNKYQLLCKLNGVSEVFPENKYDIVKVLQKHNHIVGMTGDGVNDAPALNISNIGVAVSNATDAARAAADIVLTKAGISVIVDAIKESRYIFQRITNYIIYRIAETLRLMFFITLSVILFNIYPISAIMIVYLVVANDIPIITMAYDNVVYHDRPAHWNFRNIIKISTFLGILGVISSFFAFYLCMDVFRLPLGVIQTIIFLKIAIAGHLMFFTARTKGPFWTIKPGKILLWSVILSEVIIILISLFGILVTPISWIYVIFILLYAFVSFIITDALKVVFYKYFDKGNLD